MRRDHDLPPSWDGQPIRWGEWNTARSSYSFHAKPVDLACRACGLIEESHVAIGRTAPPSTLVLFAFRCPGCQHDVVTDDSTGESWDLDETDYTDQGSTVSEALW